ncbi:hypothetical protein LBMAG18_00680 [Alphaproteobacteria bacterium]|nr:hypothetical protein LBMAG18_00680 [Alphaproteobacteria bacterium]
MKKLYISIILLVLTSCKVSIGSKAEIIYNRDDLDSKISKIIMFPTTGFDGKVNNGSKFVDTSIVAGWASTYGVKNTIPSGMLVEKLASKIGSNFYGMFLKTMNDQSILEKVEKNDQFKKFSKQVTSNLGNYYFAVSTINGGEKEYLAGKKIEMYVGLFDPKNLAWRIISKISVKKSAIANWKIDSQFLVNNSFAAIKEALNQDQFKK